MKGHGEKVNLFEAIPNKENVISYPNNFELGQSVDAKKISNAK